MWVRLSGLFACKFKNAWSAWKEKHRSFISDSLLRNSLPERLRRMSHISHGKIKFSIDLFLKEKELTNSSITLPFEHATRWQIVVHSTHTHMHTPLIPISLIYEGKLPPTHFFTTVSYTATVLIVTLFGEINKDSLSSLNFFSELFDQTR